jgi:hypothetical protein
MTVPAVKTDVVPAELTSKRHRRVLSHAERSIDADETAEASDLMAILADALEQIAATTSDPQAQAVAVQAIAEFHGR